MKYLYLSVLYLLVSCSNPKKLHKMMDKLPEATAKECADRFPIKETIDTLEVYDTALLKAYEMEFNYLYYYIDSLLGQQIHDSTKKEIVNVIQEKKIPVVKYKYITKTQESTASIQVFRDSCQKLSSKLHKKLDICDKKVYELTAKCDRYKRQRNRYFFLIIALIIFSFRKQIVALLKTI